MKECIIKDSWPKRARCVTFRGKKADSREFLPMWRAHGVDLGSGRCPCCEVGRPRCRGRASATDLGRSPRTKGRKRPFRCKHARFTARQTGSRHFMPSIRPSFGLSTSTHNINVSQRPTNKSIQSQKKQSNRLST